MVHQLDIDQYYQHDPSFPIIDVRSPAEFAHGHIPGAVNIPLFSDSERAEVGTTYVQQSRGKAIELGYTFVTPKLQYFIDQARTIAPDGELVVHCWRGGMRSQAFAQHLSDHGFPKVFLIEKGYKAYRNYVLNSLATPLILNIIGGYTGSGKTYILKSLESLGEQIIDLEKLANHKGSAFGGIGEPTQPTVEQFENNIFEKLRLHDLSKPIWLEDESHNIGAAKIPMNLFNQMRSQTVYFLDIPKRERATHLAKEYGDCDPTLLASAIELISRKLGGTVFKQTLDYLNEKNYTEVAMLTLNYYDKSYLRGLEKRDAQKVVHLELPDTDPEKNAKILLKTVDTYE